MEERKWIAILGVRGIPAAHGGFETFAARLAPYLTRAGWNVRVYCQEARDTTDAPDGATCWESQWEGVERVHIVVPADTAWNSIRFDWHCVSHALRNRPDAVLMLGYNTAMFAARLRAAGIPTVINMDGLEWQRAKWGPAAKSWLYVNERAGCRFAHHLIADHPHIGHHLQSRAPTEKITIIPYGADVLPLATDDQALAEVGVTAGRYVTLIARAEPENSILEMVRAFSAKPRNLKLLVLGKYYPDAIRYHAQVKSVASGEVLFPGAIYDSVKVRALRRHSLFYLHGHRVGGCNPSLLEAMGAGNPVVAHDNRFNRWVAGEGALYFEDSAGCERALEQYLNDPTMVERHGALNRRRAAEVFDWSEILASYAELLDAVSSEVTARGQSGWGRRAQWQLERPT